PRLPAEPLERCARLGDVGLEFGIRITPHVSDEAVGDDRFVFLAEPLVNSAPLERPKDCAQGHRHLIVRLAVEQLAGLAVAPRQGKQDRKSTRLNSSHVAISYAVFCLKKKKRIKDADDEKRGTVIVYKTRPG